MNSMDFPNITDDIKIRYDYLPIPMNYKDGDLDLEIISKHYIDDDNKTGFMKFNTKDTFVLIDSYDDNIVKGFLVKNNYLYLKFLVNYKNKIYICIKVSDKKEINEKNLIMDKYNFYYRNVNYEDFSQEICSKINDRINMIVKTNEINNVIEKVKYFIEDFTEKYQVEVKYGGGRSDEIPYILSIKNMHDPTYYSQIDIERIQFFDDFIYE